MDRQVDSPISPLAKIAVIAAVLIAMYGSPRVNAQTETSDIGRIGFAGFIVAAASDYQCVGVNPANLGFVPRTDIFTLATPMGGGSERKRRSWSVTALEGGFSVHSNALQRGDVFSLLTGATQQFTPERKIAAAQAFADNGLRFNIDVISLGVSYQTQHEGGLALTMRERASGTFVLNDEASNLIFLGKDSPYFDSTDVNWAGDTVAYARSPQQYSTLFDGSVLSMSWFREYGLSYGLQVVGTSDVSIYIGATAKYLESYAYLDARVAAGSFVARSALSPFFGINYGKATTPSIIPGTSFVPVGSGWGADIGFTIEVGRFTLSAAVVDLGKMEFDGNVFNAADTILNGLTSRGFDSYDIFTEAQKITGDGSFFKWQGLQSAHSELPTRLKFGTQFFYGYRLQFGADVVVPVNQATGAMAQPMMSVGASYRPTPWCTIGLGAGGGGSMGFYIPFSVKFSLFDGFWEMGLSSRDLITYLISRDPVVSLATGVMRFRI